MTLLKWYNDKEVTASERTRYILNSIDSSALALGGLLMNASKKMEQAAVHTVATRLVSRVAGWALALGSGIGWGLLLWDIGSMLLSKDENSPTLQMFGNLLNKFKRHEKFDQYEQETDLNGLFKEVEGSLDSWIFGGVSWGHLNWRAIVPMYEMIRDAKKDNQPLSEEQKLSVINNFVKLHEYYHGEEIKITVKEILDFYKMVDDDKNADKKFESGYSYQEIAIDLRFGTYDAPLFWPAEHPGFNHDYFRLKKSYEGMPAYNPYDGNS